MIEPLTADTVTDEQIHELLREAEGVEHNDVDLARICTAALYRAHGPRKRDALARCAEIINARAAIKARRCSVCGALCDHKSWDGIDCPWCTDARRAEEGKQP